jgi:predicted dehydrogenase
MEKIKIAVIGLGLGGKNHIRSLASNDGVKLEAIVAPDSAKNSLIARHKNVPIFTTIEECLSRCNIDGVIIASPNRLHAEQANACIEAKIPVLIEKPITSSVEQALELVNMVEKVGAKVLIGHHRAHNPILRVAREAINEGRLGKLVTVMGSAQFHKPAHYFVDGPWRKEIGGGPILINLIHEIDNLRRLVGEIKAVQAITSNLTRSFDVEDTAAIIFVFENGALGTFILSDVASTSRSWEQTSGENSSYPGYQDEDCYLISGTNGSLGVPTMLLKYYPEGIDPSWWTPFAEEVLKAPRSDPLDCQLKHFIDVIKGDVDPLVTARDGYRNLLITEAIRESARTKSIINVSA